MSNDSEKDKWSNFAQLPWQFDSLAVLFLHPKVPVLKEEGTKPTICCLQQYRLHSATNNIISDPCKLD